MFESIYFKGQNILKKVKCIIVNINKKKNKTQEYETIGNYKIKLINIK